MVARLIQIMRPELILSWQIQNKREPAQKIMLMFSKKRLRKMLNNSSSNINNNSNKPNICNNNNNINTSKVIIFTHKKLELMVTQGRWNRQLSSIGRIFHLLITKRTHLRMDLGHSPREPVEAYQTTAACPWLYRSNIVKTHNLLTEVDSCLGREKILRLVQTRQALTFMRLLGLQIKSPMQTKM